MHDIPFKDEGFPAQPVAFLIEDAGISALAERKGSFVIHASGDRASIIKRNDFVPEYWKGKLDDRTISGGKASPFAVPWG